MRRLDYVNLSVVASDRIGHIDRMTNDDTPPTMAPMDQSVAIQSNAPTATAHPATVALGGVGAVPSLPIGEDGSRVVPMLRRNGVWQPASAFATARSETIATVLAHIEEGATLTAACDVAGIPVRTWSRWCAGDESLAVDYSFSLKIGAETLYWSMLDLAREARGATTTAASVGYKLEIETLEKTAARMGGGKFGEASSPSKAPNATAAQPAPIVQQVIIRYDTPKVPKVTDIQSHALGDGSYSVDDDA